MVAVGYMDPGNWATDLAGGATFGYTLLSVVLISNLMAILLQALAVKLGVVTGRDLAQACRDHYSRRASFVSVGALRDRHRGVRPGGSHRLGDRAQPALRDSVDLGRVLTAADVLLILLLQHRGFRYLEAFVIALIATIGVCFADRDVSGQARPARRRRWADSPRPHRDRPRRCFTSPSGSWAPR